VGERGRCFPVVVGIPSGGPPGSHDIKPAARGKPRLQQVCHGQAKGTVGGVNDSYIDLQSARSVHFVRKVTITGDQDEQHSSFLGVSETPHLVHGRVHQLSDLLVDAAILGVGRDQVVEVGAEAEICHRGLRRGERRHDIIRTHKIVLQLLERSHYVNVRGELLADSASNSIAKNFLHNHHALDRQRSTKLNSSTSLNSKPTIGIPLFCGSGDVTVLRVVEHVQ
jgi:hypothetical protein